MPNIPARVGSKVLLKVVGKRVFWRCDNVLPRATEPCGAEGYGTIKGWCTARTRTAVCRRCALRLQEMRIGSLAGRLPPMEPTPVNEEHFRCTKLSVIQRRRACASMYASFNARAHEHTGSGCTKCEIGKAHSKGLRHEDAPACSQPTVVPQKPPERLCLAPRCKRQLPVGKGAWCDNVCRQEAHAAGIFVGMAMAIASRAQ